MNHEQISRLNNAIYDTLSECQGRLGATLFEIVRPFCEAIDPNWLNCSISIERHPGDEPFDAANFRSEHADSYNGIPDFNASPVHVWVNAPSCGDKEIDVSVLKAVMSPMLLVLITTNKWYLGSLLTNVISISNPEHRVQIIPGVTQLAFENTTRGPVMWGEEGDFVVVKDHGVDLPCQFERYSLERMQAELAMDYPQMGEVVDFEYLPKRFNDLGERRDHVESPIDVHRSEIELLKQQFANSETEGIDVDLDALRLVD